MARPIKAEKRLLPVSAAPEGDARMRLARIQAEVEDLSDLGIFVDLVAMPAGMAPVVVFAYGTGTGPVV